ncbi:MAG: GGDEF domain-containing protein [Lachnospiraceae bacterium]|nr:GGDEF domain-containing protein [Lachnospiraceae bacterium]
MAGRLKNIAVLCTAIDSEAQMRMIKGIERFGRKHGCNIAVFTWFTGFYEREKHNLGEVNIVNLPDLNLFDGVILAANVLHIEFNRNLILDLLKTVKVPVVSVGAKVEGCYYVGADTYRTMRELVEHFVVYHGMRRLHFVTGTPGNQDSEDRFRAYKDVLAEQGIPLEEERITQGDFYIAGGERAAQQILHSNLPFPEAVICANDMMALTLCNSLQAKGYSIPMDVAVSGYDQTLEGQQSIPMLTTAKICTDKQGEAACKLLLALSRGEEVPGEVLIADELVLGESCGCEQLDIHKRYQAQRRTIGKEAFQRNATFYMLMMEKDIMEGDEYQDWLNALKNFVVNIDPPEFYYCVNESFVPKTFEMGIAGQENMSRQERQEYSEKMDVKVAYRNGQFFTKGMFPSRYAMDELFNETEGGKLYIFSPLHYKDRNYGYFVFVNSRFPMENNMYVTWLLNMGHAIENIRKQKLLHHAMEEMDEMYIRDSLTGMYNRFGMERLLEELLKKGDQQNKKLFLAFADADGLKGINDKFGHEKGDLMIRNMACCLKGAGKNYSVVRYGGDEFLVIGLAEDAAELKEYWKRVEQLRQELNHDQEPGCVLDFSYGYELVDLTPDTNVLDYVRLADLSMYENKKKKKQHRGEE